MKKSALAALLILLMLFTLPASAGSFSIREGITWYLSLDEVILCLKKEKDFSQYTLNFTQDIMSEAFYEDVPYDRIFPQFWALGVYGSSLGTQNEYMNMLYFGTRKTGLIEIQYRFFPKNESDTAFYYSRARELTSQLTEQFGAFEVEDRWNSRSSVSEDNIYLSKKTLPDASGVSVSITQYNDQYFLILSFVCPRSEEIWQSLKDGSFYDGLSAEAASSPFDNTHWYATNLSTVLDNILSTDEKEITLLKAINYITHFVPYESDLQDFHYSSFYCGIDFSSNGCFEMTLGNSYFGHVLKSTYSKTFGAWSYDNDRLLMICDDGTCLHMPYHNGTFSFRVLGIGFDFARP